VADRGVIPVIVTQQPPAGTGAGIVMAMVIGLVCVTLKVAEADLEGSACEVAVILTPVAEVAGAVYCTAAGTRMVLDGVSSPGPVSVHVIPALVVPATAAVNATTVLTGIEVAAGKIETETRELTTSITVVVWLKLPLVPEMVSV
jgi:hypothetical protein